MMARRSDCANIAAQIARTAATRDHKAPAEKRRSDSVGEAQLPMLDRRCSTGDVQLVM